MPALTTSKPAKHFTLDQPRKFRLDWGSSNRFEEVYGKSISGAMFNDDLGTRFLTILLWACMLPFEPNLTVQEVERRMTVFMNRDGDLKGLMKVALDCVSDSGIMGKVPEKPAEEGDEPAPQADGDAGPKES